MQTHKHHIVPKYSGGTNHKTNLVRVSVKDHALLHWYAYCKRPDLILEVYSKYNVKLTSQIVNRIPLGNKKDASAAVWVSKNEIDGIDIKGKNNYSYIDGRVTGKKFENGAWDDIMKKYQAEWFQRWKESHPEKYQEKLARARAYKKANREKMTEYNREYRKRTK